ncbi:MAG: hypothetical protein H7345_18915, partial [Rubritepida sp.]|nr:hypothetical protein [Rubritepida sp.]
MNTPIITRRAMLATAAILPGAARANNLDKARRAGELLVATELHFAP